VTQGGTPPDIPPARDPTIDSLAELQAARRPGHSFDRNRAQRLSRLAEGHRTATRSGLDGCENGSTLARPGSTNLMKRDLIKTDTLVERDAADVVFDDTKHCLINGVGHLKECSVSGVDHEGLLIAMHCDLHVDQLTQAYILQ
jgi:hypothetical protein